MFSNKIITDDARAPQIANHIDGVPACDLADHDWEIERPLD
jgi:hypothetical protein